MTVKGAIIYYSATGSTYQLARAVEEGAREAGAEVRFRKVHELAPEEAIASKSGCNCLAYTTLVIATSTSVKPLIGMPPLSKWPRKTVP
jgi:multimeric flavodoxin WrbA